MVSLAELATVSSMRHWATSGPNAVVKIVGTLDASVTARSGSVQGYVTQAKYVDGLNAHQIEGHLGLRPGSMNRGLFVFWLLRLPTPDEVEQRFTAVWPDGRVWTDDRVRHYMRARDALLTSASGIVDDYPPGSAAIPQWKLLKRIPIARHYRQATPSLPLTLL